MRHLLNNCSLLRNNTLKTGVNEMSALFKALDFIQILHLRIIKKKLKKHDTDVIVNQAKNAHPK